MRIIKSSKAISKGIKNILVVDDSLSTAGNPEWVVFQLNTNEVDPEELAAASLGFATDTPYADYFKKGVKILDSNDEHSPEELEGNFDKVLKDLGWKVFDGKYYLTDLAKKYD